AVRLLFSLKPGTFRQTMFSMSQMLTQSRVCSIITRDAYNRLDANALWRIWPSASANVKRAIENSFDNAISIEMHLQMQDPKPGRDGASASVRGRFSQIYVTRQGNEPPRKDGDITFVLKKNSGVWTINEVRY